jgi:hypothetical protein
MRSLCPPVWKIFYLYVHVCVAPELLSMNPYGHSVDWWSLGIIAYAMLLGEVGVTKPAHYTENTLICIELLY